MKFASDEDKATGTNVTPHAGVWIEIGRVSFMPSLTKVTPHAGVWIEIERREPERR